MNAAPEPSRSMQQIAEDAARWLAKRDRELTAAEQDEYLQWLQSDPRHGRAIAQLERTWRRLDILNEWRPKHATQPNPDLLAPPASSWRRYAKPALLVSFAAAAAVAIGIFVARQPKAERAVPTASRSGVKVLPGPERLVLSDGSIVQRNSGSQIQPAFSPAERRVRLVAGEALFMVAKNPARPFVVEVGAVTVRAVGTAFDVRRSAESVEVLVTEGTVRLERNSNAGAAPTLLGAGQRAVIETSDRTRPPAISPVTPSEREEALAWQAVRLEFSELPLADVVAEFNLRNERQLVVGDLETAQLRLGGTFRADNIDGFVRLLDASLGVKAETRSDGTIVLRRSH